MIKFGTGGWRAVIADEFTMENIRLLMAGLGRLMEKEGLSGAEICVGYDRRFLSKESAHWAAEVLAGYGFRVYMINRSSPTPLMIVCPLSSSVRTVKVGSASASLPSALPSLSRSYCV